jgi:hypothetical protein
MSHGFKRKYDNRNEYRFIYIFTEGEKTETNYFKSKKEEIEQELRKKRIKVKINGDGYNTLSLVEYALDFMQKEGVAIGSLEDEDECWVVFDKDNFLEFNNAIEKAEANGLKVAYSNECFELWFLLHFSYFNSAVGRGDYNLKLTDLLQKKTKDRRIEYNKSSKNMYALIKDKECDAIRNAKKLLISYKGQKPFSKNNPSTTVHLLVESLNNLK